VKLTNKNDQYAIASGIYLQH